eukprot:14070563-Heterocapsa_arctica.AAC.1
MLYSLLVTLVSGKALGIVRKVPEGYGLEAWRRLVAEYEPQVATRFCAMLTTLPSPVFNEAVSFMDQVNDWERG